MIAIEKPQLPTLPKLNYGEGTFAYTDNGAIAYKKYIRLSDGSTIRKTVNSPTVIECIERMSNIIRLNETAPNNGWIVMSNQGMDCFLDLLITAADVFEKTEHQNKLISFLKDQKGISCIRMGTINRKRLY